MKIKVHLITTSEAIEHSAINAYTKGGMYCIMLEDRKVFKYPMCNIFRVEEQL